MKRGSTIEAATIAAYERTRYAVRYESGEFVLVPGAASTELRRVYARYAVSTAAFVTGWNPRSEPAGDPANGAAQAALRADLRALRCVVLEAFGADVSGRYAGEPSLLALGPTESQARELGRRYAQNAILFAGDDAIPRLVLLR